MRRGAVRTGLAILAIVIVLVAGAGALFVLTFNPNEMKPRIIAAVEQATGRDLVLSGDIGLKLSLWPTLQVSGVTLSNAPGFTPADMVTLNRLELQLAVPALLRHRIEISRLVLVQPVVHLQTNAQGKSNWVFAPQAARPPAARARSSAGPGAREIGIAAVRVTDGTVTYRDDRTGRTRTLKVAQFTANAASPDARLHLNLDGDADGAAFNLAGDVGSLEPLLRPASTTPWPVNVTLSGAGARLSADGTLTEPLRGRGYALAVRGSIANLAMLAPLVSARDLPPLRDLKFSTRIADGGKSLPRISDLTLHIGPSDLGAVASGLKIDRVAVNAPASDQPIQASGAGTFAGGPVTLAATLGPLAALTAGPFPIDMKGQLAGGSFEAKGAIADPAKLSGVGLDISALVPDLSVLSPLAGHPLPAIKAVVLHAELNDAAGGFRQGAALRDIKLTTAAGDLSGEAALTIAGRPAVTANLVSTRIDADALMVAAGTPVQTARPGAPSPPAKPAPAAGSPPAGQASPAATTAGPTTGAASAQVPPGQLLPSGPLFSDRPLPFARLRMADGDITLTVQDLHSGTVDYRAVNLHAVLRDGRLTVSPFAAELPGGPMSGALHVDASATGPGASPPVVLTLAAPGVDVAPLLSAMGLPGYASGKLEVRADLNGAGVSAHAIAADLNGTLGLVMEGGTVDAALIDNLLGGVLAKAHLAGVIAQGGSTDVRCFATHAVAQNGVATVNPLLLSTVAMTVSGSGRINLGPGTLDMTMRPQGRVGGTGIVVPVQLTGPIRSPRAEVNALTAVQSNAGALLGRAGQLGALGQALLRGQPDGSAPAGASLSCPEALALARGEAQPAAPAAPAAARPRAERKPPNAGALLRQLFH